MEVVAPFLSALAVVIVAIGTYFTARRLGLTDLQKAVRVETDSLVSRLRDRVILLEAENSELRKRVENLNAQTLAMRGRIDDLEEALANVAIKRPRRAESGAS